MKKKNILILLVICMLFCINSVKAKTLDCGYDATKSLGFPNNLYIDFEYKEENGERKYSKYSSSTYGWNEGWYQIPIIADFEIQQNFGATINSTILNVNDCGTEFSDDRDTDTCAFCPSNVTVCKASGAEYSPSWWVLVFIKSDSMINIDTSKDTSIVLGGKTYYIDKNDCQIYKYDSGLIEGSEEFETTNVNQSCDMFNEAVKNLEEVDYTKNYQMYVGEKEKLTNFCKNTLTNFSYKENGEINACVANCLKLDDFISSIENSNGGEKTCGFSQRLIVWVGNIIKWIKYIIPVIVIILGIIDFIKAIASSSDDEMKKAQGRFIKRLVAAALIFIIPFIIEFILDKTGFSEYVSGCGVIDL